MDNWTVSKRIIFGFGAITMIAVGLGVFAEIQLRQIKSSTGLIIGDCLPGLRRSAYLAENMQLLANDSSTLVLKHIMAPDAELKLDFENRVQTNLLAITRMIGEYEHATHDAEEFKLNAVVDERFAAYQEILTGILRLSKNGSPQEAMELRQQKLEPAHARLQAEVHKLVEFNNAKGEDAGRQICAAVASSESGVWMGLATNLLVAVVISFVIIYSTTKALKKMAGSLSEASAHVFASASQVNETSQSLAAGASEQTSSLIKATAVLEQIASMAGSNSANARRAQQLASHTRASADAGFSDMQELSRAVQDIRNCNHDVVKIVNTIDEIALQTNILALNAAVEAARAGEAGLGFAVVADEVRNLAQRSALAARETAQRIGASLEKSERGVSLNAKVAAGLSEIVQQVRKADDLATEIAQASQEQNTGIIQVKESVVDLNRITRNNSANAEATAEAAGELAGESEILEALVGNISKLVGSPPAGHSISPPSSTGSAERPEIINSVVSRPRLVACRQD